MNVKHLPVLVMIRMMVKLVIMMVKMPAAKMKVKCAITLLREATRKQRRDKARAVSPVLPPNTNTRGYQGSQYQPKISKYLFQLYSHSVDVVIKHHHQGLPRV